MNCLVCASAFSGTFGFLLSVFACQGAGVKFPGPQPGPAQASGNDSDLTLENAVLSATWKPAGGTLRPVRLTNKLTGQSFDQTGAELFRLALESGRAQTNGIRVAVRLLDDKVVALASKDERAGERRPFSPGCSLRAGQESAAKGARTAGTLSPSNSPSGVSAEQAGRSHGCGRAK